jgi:hypothetical protein
LLGILLFGVITEGRAQTVMFPEGAVMCSIQYGLAYRGITEYNPNKELSGYDAAEVNSTYKVKKFNPSTFSIEYGLRDHLAIGLVASFATYDLQETKIVPLDTTHFSIQGSRIALHLRAIRYFIQKSNFMIYLFGQAGLKVIRNHYSSSDEYTKNLSNLNLYPAIKDKYSSLSAEAGIGFKFLVTRRIGLGIECGAIASYVRVGVCYRFINKYRNTKDVIGW